MFVSSPNHLFGDMQQTKIQKKTVAHFADDFFSTQSWIFGMPIDASG
jgi:hypothetical protein